MSFPNKLSSTNSPFIIGLPVDTSASFLVNALPYNPGTISVSGANVTGIGTEFTKTFKVGDSITTTTNNGTHTREIQTISSDTSLTAVSSFTGTNSGATYTSSNTGSQFAVLPNGGIRGMGTTGLSSSNTSDWIYKADTISYTGSQLHSAFRDRTTYNPTGSSTSTLNSIAAGANLNATGSGGFTNVRAFNAFPTVVSTNTGNINTLSAFLSAPQVQSGATGTISNFIGFSFNSANSSTTNTITNMYGVSLTPTQAGGTLTNYAGVAIAAKPVAATNSSLLLLGTTTIPSGNYSIYSSSTSANYFAGDLQLNKTVTAGGTTGAQTINKTAGSVNFAAVDTSLVVTNNLVTTNSVIIATVATNDTTMKSVSVVASAGSFTLHANASATAETRVNFVVIN